MARMHARRRGKSCSVRPHRKEAPSWSNTDIKGIEKVIIDL
ncbi:MAG: 30S ribosomal protein S15, partial [Deltaproteobacteria bacterium]|nr:30S ribosomal protein S15 [Deltaproteobacteria bacterium]